MKAVWLLLAATACTRPSEQRAVAELDVGLAAISDADVTVAGGLAAIRELTDHRLVLWGSAPVFSLDLTLGATAAGTWTIVVRNSLPDAVLVVDGITHARALDSGPTVATFELPLGEGAHRMRLAPPDADTPGPFRVAAMADIQTALPIVDDVFAAINAVPDARFVVAMGDITQRAEEDEYDMFDRQLAYLKIPFYTTLGNHELWSPPERYFERYGRASFQFIFKGCAFTFADSGDAAIDPLVDEWLTDWFAQTRDMPSVFLTHMPPIDPNGLRYGSFRSTRDGQRLISRLVDGRVDLTLYGHIHTYVAYENAGIPAFISGGGGAEPMKGDGIDRHFLMVKLDASASPTTRGGGLPALPPGGLVDVELHRVD